MPLTPCRRRACDARASRPAAIRPLAGLRGQARARDQRADVGGVGHRAQHRLRLSQRATVGHAAIARDSRGAVRR